ncbi:uncharacterized protein [Chelonus insularis]|uniref:uncharacterized protein n=1 Tax=Chelonus insularis TaxID=460826 RepID=UPI00158CAE2B|nr:uncharacterized protein LOC118072992 [Chelonus insularis]
MFVYFLLFCLISEGLGEPAEVLLEYQDSFGQYSFGYSAPDSARSEVRSSDGSTRGVFSYIDGSGIIQTAKYTADSVNGFKIEASNLPQAPKPVEETPEVKAARLEHLRAYEAARKDAENEQEQASKQDNKIKQKLVKSSTQQNTADNKMKEQQTSTLNQLPQVLKINTMNRDQTSNVPFVATSFILPSSNSNLQNRINLKSTDSSSSTSTESIIQGKGDMMKKDETEKDDSKLTQISQTQLHQLDSSPSIVSIPSYRIPVYSYNQRLQFIPSYYYY